MQHLTCGLKIDFPETQRQAAAKGGRDIPELMFAAQALAKAKTDAKVITRSGGTLVAFVA